MVNISDYPIANRDVVSRLVDGELILVFPKHGQVKVLNEVATRIWNLSDGKHSIEDIISVICDEFSVTSAQAKEDVLEFFIILTEKQMITLQPSNSFHNGVE